MAARCETAQEEGADSHTSTGRKWEAFAGTHVTLYALQGSSATERAGETLREAEQIIEALRRLLSPEEERNGAPVCIYLTDPTAPTEDRLFTKASVGEALSRQEETSGSESLSSVVFSEESPGQRASLLTRHLIGRWFGAGAAQAGIFLEGIAGLAAANAGLGPSLEEADRWVRAERAAKRPIFITTRRETGQKAPVSGVQDGFHLAATSFLGFLVAQFGQSALHTYLDASDPDRRDQAANTAYNQPLALLEEEWLARLHRRAEDRDALRTFVRQILPLLKPYRWKQLEILVYLLLAAGYNVVQPYAIKTIIDRLTTHVRSGPGALPTNELFLKTLVPFLLALAGIYILNGIVSLRRAYTVSWLNQNVLNTLQIRMYAHLQRLSHSFYINAKLGDIMARINDDLDQVQSALSQITNKALYQSFTVVGALTALFLLTSKSPAVAIPILCIIPLFAVNYAALRSRNKQASREQRRRVGQAMVTVQQNLSAHAVIKAFGMEERAVSEYQDRVHALQRSKLRLSLLSALTDLSEEMTTALAQLVIFGVGGYLVLRDGGKSLGVGDLSALLILVKSIFGPIASLSGIGQTMQQATGAMERVTELFDEPITISDKPDAAALPLLSRDIRLENVTFRYGGERAALRDVSLIIPAGANVAIVGPSGSGKSSLVNLFLRFWDPEEGRVLFDGHDLRDVTLASLRGQIGLVFQETFIFNTTLRDNIAIGRPDATDAEIVAAAKAAQLDSFIESLPAGYDTIPGENGARLSSGQKQRIAIARTFLRNPRILILDEATSALDAKTEAGVLETLAELAKGRTTISVTHRISQAATADRIFVLDTGRLVEQGTHEALIKAGGLYQKLYAEATGFVANGGTIQTVAAAA
jgi:ABC-type multidrug transport system fused ATPase/permease subunit